MKTVPKAQGKTGVSHIYACFNLKRNAYYKYQKRNIHRQEEARRVLELVKKERAAQPRVGTRKLYRTSKPAFMDSNLKIGRDTLFNIL